EKHLLRGARRDQSRAIFLGEIGDFQQLLPGYAAYGHGKPDIVEPRLFLPIDSQVIDVFVRSFIPAGRQQRSAGAPLQLFAKLLDTPIVDQKGEAGFSAQLAKSMIAEGTHDLATYLGGFSLSDE